MGHILLVDDDAALRRTLRAMLERAGYAVVEAGDGDQAMASFTADRPDLVLTDIIMPNREGVETIRDLRAHDPSVPIIAMSGGGQTGGDLFLKIAGRLGAAATLAKPIRQATLLALIAAHHPSPPAAG